MNSTRAIGTPVWIVSITLRTASPIEGKVQIAADTASGSGCRRSVIEVITPSVPSEPTSRRVRS